MEWHHGIEQLRPSVLRISTPQCAGTGWLLSLSKTTGLCGIATAAHVIDHAHYWEQPLRIHHPISGKTVLLRPADRAIHLYEEADTAAIVFDRFTLDLALASPTTIASDTYIKPGVEIGWLGFPAVAKTEMCFFSGRVSTYVQSSEMYLVDGVAIN